jgi:hypothetical protein
MLTLPSRRVVACSIVCGGSSISLKLTRLVALPAGTRVSGRSSGRNATRSALLMATTLLVNDAVFVTTSGFLKAFQLLCLPTKYSGWTGKASSILERAVLFVCLSAAHKQCCIQQHNSSSIAPRHILIEMIRPPACGPTSRWASGAPWPAGLLFQRLKQNAWLVSFSRRY